MNLLEHFERNLVGEKKQVAISLLNMPWKANLEPIRRHLPRSLSRRLADAQHEVRVRLACARGEPPPRVWLATHHVGIGERSPTLRDGKVFRGYHSLEWEDRIWTQILEDLEKNKVPSLNMGGDSRRALVLLYTLAHACLFVLAGLHAVAAGGWRGAALVRSVSALDAHRLYWFCHYMMGQSQIADGLAVRSEVEQCIEKGWPVHRAFGASSRRLIRLRDRFLDKHLSLNLDYLGLLVARDLAESAKLVERAGLIVHIHVQMIYLQLQTQAMDGSVLYDRLLPLRIQKADLKRAGFGDDLVGKLLAECARKPIGDRLLQETAADTLQLGDLNVKYALQTYCKANMEAMKGRGIWFEKSYIANYIAERVPSHRYRVHPGFDDEVEKYDVDVVIEDTKTGILYFCQVKHRVAALLPHLRDEMKEYSSNSEILKGLGQIKRLREVIESEGVLTRVRQKVRQRKLTSKELNRRARYLIIHNSESLDFCTSEGVAMYEWNMLRNLLKGTTGFVFDGESHSVSMAELDFPLDDPQKTMEVLWAWLDAGMREDQPMRPSTQWEGFKSTRLLFLARRSIHSRARSLLPLGGFELNFPLT